LNHAEQLLQQPMPLQRKQRLPWWQMSLEQLIRAPWARR
jgi:hypothetical protein